MSETSDNVTIIIMVIVFFLLPPFLVVHYGLKEAEIAKKECKKVVKIEPICEGVLFCNYNYIFEDGTNSILEGKDRAKNGVYCRKIFN